MATDPDEPARLLVDAGVYSIEQVEALIALTHGGSAGCTASDLAALLRTTDDDALGRLTSLAALGLATTDGGESTPPRWQLSSARAGIAEAVAELAELMTKDRQRVVNQFYSERIARLRAFSEAFRFRRDQ